MRIRNLMISMLGLALSCRASMTFYNGTAGNTQYTTDVSAASLVPSGLFTFTGANVVSGNTEYSDPTTLVNFFAFTNADSSNTGPATTFSVSGSRLVSVTGTGSIEIMLPANVFAFAMTVSSAASAGAYCAGVNGTDGGCGNPVNVANSGDSQFFGVISTTAINSVWISRSVGSAPAIVNFQDATGGASATPETRSLILLGSGLVLLGLLKRRSRARAAARSEQCSPA